MKQLVRILALFLALYSPSGISAPVFFRNINLDTTLLGIEYTFQDQGMVNEPGRMTFETPHKRARFEEFKQAYLKQLGLNESNLGSYGTKEFKPGETITVPHDGTHVVNMEPVTIEVNTPPKRFNDVEAAAQKIFQAASSAKLVPYVNPAAERSGMGHIHVGAAKIGESPFYKNPLLLRNMMVYEHKHPSVLWGFAEAYDIDDINIRSGNNITNIESYHRPEQEAAFKRAVAKFDAWYSRTTAQGGDLSDGLRQYLRFLREEQKPPRIDFFHHYRFMNLEHLQEIADSPIPIDPNKAGKYTVEFRNLRPPKTAQHAVAHAELLLSMMDVQANPGHLERFVEISPTVYDRFHSATRVAADWEIVKRDLGRYNPLWDDSVNEFVELQLGKTARAVSLPGGLQAEAYPAYSPKKAKGTKFELRLSAAELPVAPELEIVGRKVGFERVRVQGKDYWVSVVNQTQLNFLTGEKPFITKLKLTCSELFSNLGR